MTRGRGLMHGTLDYSRMRRHGPDIIAIPSTVHIMRKHTLHGMVAMMRPTQYPQGFPGNCQDAEHACL